MLKQILISGCAGYLMIATVSAADLPKRAVSPPVFAAPVFTWSGFYVGLNAGYAFSERQIVRTTGLTAIDQALIDTGGVGSVGFAQDGATVGGGLGYNLQFSPGSGVVIGFETDAQYTDLDRTRSSAFDFAGGRFTVSGRQSLDFLGTVRGRVGYAFDRVLVYGTGGFAYGDVRYETRADISLFGGVPFDASRFSDLTTGYAYGGGVEVAIPGDSVLNFVGAAAVTVKAEYLHYDLGQKRLTATGVGPVFGAGGILPVGQTGLVRFQTEGNLVRGGINYKFGS
nr:porin family protein [Methylobacterium pseudosasicola]